LCLLRCTIQPDSEVLHRVRCATHAGTQSAEYKQATVLLAEVAHLMDIAAAVGAERLHEITAELVNCASSVVRHVVCWAVVAMLDSWNACGTTTFAPVRNLAAHRAGRWTGRVMPEDRTRGWSPSGKRCCE
jgi:hypothetical protein